VGTDVVSRGFEQGEIAGGVKVAAPRGGPGRTINGSDAGFNRLVVARAGNTLRDSSHARPTVCE
jgi:hypothetical protein